MSDKLDDKLREILQQETGQEFRPEIWTEAIAHIKAAFADEGYELSKNKRRAKLRKELEDIRDDNFMTGAEWFEAYKKEVQDWDKSVEDLDHWDYLAAAKRAAGIELMEDKG